jgi:hypothetical protein
VSSRAPQRSIAASSHASGTTPSSWRPANSPTRFRTTLLASTIKRHLPGAGSAAIRGRQREPEPPDNAPSCSGLLLTDRKSSTAAPCSRLAERLPEFTAACLLGGGPDHGGAGRLLAGAAEAITVALLGHSGVRFWGVTAFAAPVLAFGLLVIERSWLFKLLARASAVTRGDHYRSSAPPPRRDAEGGIFGCQQCIRRGVGRSLRLPQLRGFDRCGVDRLGSEQRGQGSDGALLAATEPRPAFVIGWAVAA